jgi:hypothetical protein
LLLLACAYGTGQAPDHRRPQESGGAVQLIVTNRSGGSMEVSAAGTGTGYRMGTVLPGLTGYFVVRPGLYLNGPVEFVARSDPGTPAIRSGRLMLTPGNIVEFVLDVTAMNSIATVRP